MVRFLEQGTFKICFVFKNGYRVTAIIPDDGYKDLIKSEGIDVLLVQKNIRGKGIYKKFTYIISLIKNISKE